MVKEHLTKYTEYNLWANNAIIKEVEKLSSEEREREMKTSFPSVTKTLYHMWDAQDIWINRLNGISPTGWQSHTFKGSFDEFTKLFEKSSVSIIDYVKKIEPDHLELECAFKSTKGEPFSMPRYEMIHHCMNHSTFHRGQIISMLRELGGAAFPSTDYITYIRERGNK